MLSNVDWLIKYRDQLQKLNKLKKDRGESGAFDDVELAISPSVTITESWTNKENGNQKVYKFPVSQLPDYFERIRKKLEYREKNPKQNKGEK